MSLFEIQKRLFPFACHRQSLTVLIMEKKGISHRSATTSTINYMQNRAAEWLSKFSSFPTKCFNEFSSVDRRNFRSERNQRKVLKGITLKDFRDPYATGKHSYLCRQEEVGENNAASQRPKGKLTKCRLSHKEMIRKAIQEEEVNQRSSSSVDSSNTKTYLQQLEPYVTEAIVKPEHIENDTQIDEIDESLNFYLPKEKVPKVSSGVDAAVDTRQTRDCYMRKSIIKSISNDFSKKALQQSILEVLEDDELYQLTTLRNKHIQRIQKTQAEIKYFIETEKAKQFEMINRIEKREKEKGEEVDLEERIKAMVFAEKVVDRDIKNVAELLSMKSLHDEIGYESLKKWLCSRISYKLLKARADRALIDEMIDRSK